MMSFSPFFNEHLCFTVSVLFSGSYAKRALQRDNYAGSRKKMIHEQEDLAYASQF